MIRGSDYLVELNKTPLVFCRSCFSWPPHSSTALGYLAQQHPGPQDVDVRKGVQISNSSHALPDPLVLGDQIRLYHSSLIQMKPIEKTIRLVSHSQYVWLG